MVMNDSVVVVVELNGCSVNQGFASRSVLSQCLSWMTNCASQSTFVGGSCRVELSLRKMDTSFVVVGAVALYYYCCVDCC